MSETVGDFVVKRLSEWGVKRIYGYPGDGINGVLVAMARADPLIDFVQVLGWRLSGDVRAGRDSPAERII